MNNLKWFIFLQKCLGKLSNSTHFQQAFSKKTNNLKKRDVQKLRCKDEFQL